MDMDWRDIHISISSSLCSKMKTLALQIVRNNGGFSVSILNTKRKCCANGCDMQNRIANVKKQLK